MKMLVFLMVPFFILILLFCPAAFSAAEAFDNWPEPLNSGRVATPFPAAVAPEPEALDLPIGWCAAATPTPQPSHWLTRSRFIKLTQLVGSADLSGSFISGAQKQL